MVIRPPGPGDVNIGHYVMSTRTTPVVEHNLVELQMNIFSDNNNKTTGAEAFSNIETDISHLTLWAKSYRIAPF